MSFPIPTTTMDPAMLKEMDVPLVELAQKSGGDLRQLFYGLFSFLHRRTDFYCVPHEQDINNGNHYMGFKEGDAEKLLIAAFRQFPLRKMPQKSHASSNPSDNPLSHKAGVSDATETDPTHGVVGGISLIKKDESHGKQKEEEIKKSIRKASEEDLVEKTRLTEEGLQIPIGNGGSTSKYRWTQTIDEVSILVGSLPHGIRGKDIAVIFKSNFITVKLKSSDHTERQPPTFLQGCLSNRIKIDESTWSLEGGVLLLVLQKASKIWWSNVLDCDDKIDTTLVDSRRRLDEYDDSTQGIIRRIIFDQQQENLGKPKSDELLKRSSKEKCIVTSSRNRVPPLPPGVEYIDKTTL